MPATRASAAAAAVPFIDRVLRAVKKLPGGCWEFTGGITSAGYGIVGGRTTKALAHVVTYTDRHGPVPDGLVVGHRCHDEAAARGDCSGGPTCHHRRCVNPDHLQPMTPGENSRSSAVMGAPRRETCKNGHVMAETRRTTTRSDGRPHSFCGACRDETTARATARRAERRRAERIAGGRFDADLSPEGKVRLKR